MKYEKDKKNCVSSAYSEHGDRRGRLNGRKSEKIPSGGVDAWGRRNTVKFCVVFLDTGDAKVRLMDAEGTMIKAFEGVQDITNS